MTFNRILFFCTIPLLFSCSNGESNNPPPKAMVQNGTDTGGGGDMQDIQKYLVDFKKKSLIRELKRVTQEEPLLLKKSLQGFVRNYESYDLPEDIKIIMRSMTEQGIVEDIDQTKIVEGPCFDKYGIQRSATSAMSQKGADICFDSERIVDALGTHITDSSLIALLMHEYSHHFGYEDSDYALAHAILIAIQKESEELLERGENPDNLVRNNLWIYESKAGEVK